MNDEYEKLKQDARRFSPITSIFAYGPPPRRIAMEDELERIVCIFCKKTIAYNSEQLCIDCSRQMRESQKQLNQYMEDLIKWFRSQNWSYDQVKQALDHGLKVLK